MFNSTSQGIVSIIHVESTQCCNIYIISNNENSCLIIFCKNVLLFNLCLYQFPHQPIKNVTIVIQNNSKNVCGI